MLRQLFQSPASPSDVPLKVCSNIGLCCSRWARHDISTGTDMFKYDLSDSSFSGVFSSEPAYDPPFTTSPAKVSEFLMFLEERGFIQPKLECHNLKRVVGKDSSELPSFTITSSEKVGFKVKGAEKSQKGLLASLTPENFGSKDLVKVVMRCKFQEKDKIIVPQRPIITAKKSYRIPANTIIKLNSFE